MKVGTTVSGSAGNRRAELPVLTVLFICCMVFSGVLYAQETPATEVAATETPAEEVTTAEAPTVETEAVPAVKKDPGEAAALKLEETLKKNNKCLKCHKRDKSKLLEDGEEMSLQVHQDDYLSSAHGEGRCTSCHRAIGKRKHPSKKTNITISSQRDYSLEMNDSCRKCHRQKFTQYKGSVHATMVAQGNTKAPLCTDCHSAHAVESMRDYQAVTGLPCKNCHEGVFHSYSESVHGQARISGNIIRDSHIQSPICADCHKSHEVTALAIGDTLRTTCIGCHENVILLHTQWLPNAGTHLDIISCAVCHAPFARRKFDLHLFDNASRIPVSQREGDDSIQQQMQAMQKTGGSVADMLKTWREKQDGDMQGQSSNISLRARMEVQSGVAAHQIASKSFAIRTCDSCHKDDRRQGQNVTLTVTKADGRTESIEADPEVLEAVSAVNSISDFYALGGNPNKILDYLLLLSLAAGIAVPIGHFTMGKMIKEKIEKGEQ